MRSKTAITALSILAAFALACGFGSEETSSSGGGSNNGGETQQKPAEGAKLNQAVRDGKFEFIVTAVKCGQSKVGSDGLYHKAQGEFCTVSVTVKNIGTESQIFDSPSQKAFDDKGTQYSSDPAAEGYANPKQAVYQDVNPGNQFKSKLVYDVPKGTKLTKLELHDSPLSGGVTVALT